MNGRSKRYLRATSRLRPLGYGRKSDVQISNGHAGDGLCYLGGHEFGIYYSQASRYFTRFFPLISSNFRQLIVWPSDETIHRAMPIGFRKSFKKVSRVGDCLEIAIQKPVHAFEQALTRSDYKKANTIKYYVVITPNGLF
jgi:hypothetical protein